MGANLALCSAPIGELSALDWLRVADAILVDEECWLWIGPTNGRGYGRLGLGPWRRRRHRLAHRIVYAILVGDVDSELGHTCASSLCVRPSHLRPVTRLENLIEEHERNGWNSGLVGGRVTDAPV